MPELMRWCMIYEKDKQEMTTKMKNVDDFKKGDKVKINYDVLPIDISEGDGLTFIIDRFTTDAHHTFAVGVDCETYPLYCLEVCDE